MKAPPHYSEARSCEGKTRLAKNKAADIARHMRRKGENVLEYPCKYCGSWHVGHNSRVK